MSARLARRDAQAPADPELMARLANGEIGALGELYDQHRPHVRRFVVRATANAEDVDDLVHATFLQAAKSAQRYDGRASCRPWLIGIAVVLLRRRGKAFRRLMVALTFLRGIKPTSQDPRPVAHARSEVDRALGRLSEAKRTTFLLAELEGFDCQEIADLLAVPIGTVWTRLHAARRELRVALKGGAP